MFHVVNIEVILGHLFHRVRRHVVMSTPNVITDSLDSTWWYACRLIFPRFMAGIIAFNLIRVNGQITPKPA